MANTIVLHAVCHSYQNSYRLLYRVLQGQYFCAHITSKWNTLLTFYNLIQFLKQPIVKTFLVTPFSSLSCDKESILLSRLHFSLFPHFVSPSVFVSPYFVFSKEKEETPLEKSSWPQIPIPAFYSTAFLLVKLSLRAIMTSQPILRIGKGVKWVKNLHRQYEFNQNIICIKLVKNSYDISSFPPAFSSLLAKIEGGKKEVESLSRLECKAWEKISRTIRARRPKVCGLGYICWQPDRRTDRRTNRLASLEPIAKPVSQSLVENSLLSHLSWKKEGSSKERLWKWDWKRNFKKSGGTYSLKIKIKIVTPLNKEWIFFPVVTFALQLFEKTAKH